MRLRNGQCTHPSSIGGVSRDALSSCRNYAGAYGHRRNVRACVLRGFFVVPTLLEPGYAARLPANYVEVNARPLLLHAFLPGRADSMRQCI